MSTTITVWELAACLASLLAVPYWRRIDRKRVLCGNRKLMARRPNSGASLTVDLRLIKTAVNGWLGSLSVNPVKLTVTRESLTVRYRLHAYYTCARLEFLRFKKSPSPPPRGGRGEGGRVEDVAGWARYRFVNGPSVASLPSADAPLDPARGRSGWWHP